MLLRGMAIWGVLLLASQAGAADITALRTHEEKVSYGLGVDVARNFQRTGVQFDPEILVRGFRDEVRGKLLMTEDELRETLGAFHDAQARRREQALTRAAEENRKMGEEFLAENKTRKGVVTLPSGLQYRILKAGSGRRPAEGDTVECRFRVSLVNGVEIASSRRSGETVIMKVAGPVAGLTEALKLMPVGSQWELFIPSGLAYGEKGTASGIGPNSAVIFELELVAIR